MSVMSNSIFVFGSNQAGRHGKGAAQFARRFHGAIAGQGEGAQGCSYAIPTKDASLRTLPLEAIAVSIGRFLGYAASNPNDTYRVARIGCGLAGYQDEQILMLFQARLPLPANCQLPGVWLRRLNESLMRVIVAGGRDYGKAGGEPERLYDDLDRLRERHAERELEIVSGCARGADTLGERWAQERGVPVAHFPADWDRYGKAAGFIRNRVMAWYGTHLVAYWDECSRGTRDMLDTAKAEGLPCWLRRYESHR